MKSMDRREFLRNLLLGSAGFLVTTKFASLPVFAVTPWEERTDSILLAESNGDLTISPLLTLGKGIKNEYPAIALDTRDTLWMSWTGEEKGREEIRLNQPYKDVSEFGYGFNSISEGTHAFQSAVTIKEGGGAVVWAEFLETGSWQIQAALIKNMTFQKRIPVSESQTLAWHPCIARDKKDNIWIVWEEKENGFFQIKARSLKDGNLSPILTISEHRDKDNCRPAIAVTTDDKIWIGWDCLDNPGALNIRIRQITTNGGFATKEITVTNSAGLDCATALSVDADNRLWIAWHSNRWGDDNTWDIPRWFRLQCYHGSEFYEPVSEPPGKTNERADTIQSFEFVRLHCTGDGKVIITGRASHNFYMQYYQGSQWSPVYRFPPEGWGGRGQYLQIAEDSTGLIWVARRDLVQNAIQSVTLPKSTMTIAPVLKTVAVHRANIIIPNAPVKPAFEPQNGYHFYFGDIHGHTWMSDGVGDVDEYYITRRDFYKLDFASLTDHDTFVDNSLSPSEWEQIKEITTHYNEPQRFVTFYGQEWTTARWPKAFGHKNIYHIDPALKLFDHLDESSKTTHELFECVKEAGAIAIPHHIGWTGVDWENHDPVAQPLVEIISAHGAFEYMGNKPIPHRGGIKGCFVQDGLAQGHRFGIIGSTDSHGLIWHHGVCYKRDPNRSGWTCILAKELTREALWEALKARRCYASSGIWLRMVFEINGHMMGEEFQSYETPTIKVDVNSESQLKWIEIVRNNEAIYTYGGEGHQSRFTFVDNEAYKKPLFYYLRVTCEDNNMAWSSPIWMNYVPA